MENIRLLGIATFFDQQEPLISSFLSCYPVEYFFEFRIAGKITDFFMMMNRSQSVKQMRIDHRDQGEVCIVDIRGSIILGEIDELKHYFNDLIEGSPSLRCLLVNLQWVDFIDSSGLGVFISCWRQLKDRKAVFALSDLNSKLGRLMTMTSLGDFIKIYESEALALEDENLFVMLFED